ncbi:MAG TPA: AbrB/MazE/SpoVT family DNA-binding domain-containing protein [Clostridia bacterium]|nr:AbrB/MazE/SpoVT family DNA-binding domain-containing protein [Clostridia bacterium]
MITKLQKWGNSQGIRIPKEVLMDTSLCEGDKVDITSNGDTIIIRRLYKPIKKYSLEDLLKGCNETQVEENWGTSVGKEEW